MLGSDVVGGVLLSGLHMHTVGALALCALVLWIPSTHLEMLIHVRDSASYPGANQKNTTLGGAGRVRA